MINRQIITLLYFIFYEPKIELNESPSKMYEEMLRQYSFKFHVIV